MGATLHQKNSTIRLGKASWSGRSFVKDETKECKKKQKQLKRGGGNERLKFGEDSQNISSRVCLNSDMKGGVIGAKLTEGEEGVRKITNVKNVERKKTN